MPKTIRVTLPLPSFVIQERGQGYSTFTASNPTREFKGLVSWAVTACGALNIYVNEVAKNEVSVSFGPGQWVSVEYLREPLKRPGTEA